MRRLQLTPTRHGHTLIELVAALGGAGVLLAGLTSSMFIALKASDTTNSPATATVDAHGCLVDMIAEIQYAKTITEQTATAITVTVPDRDLDTVEETIRYAWSGTVGAPLTRQYNSGTAGNVAEGVHDFSVEYYQPATSVEYLTVRLQITNDPRTRIDTGIPLVNKP